MPRRVLALLLAALALACTNAQTAGGYSSAPYYVNTFDRAPTVAEKGASTFTYVPTVQFRRGAALFDRMNRDYIDLLRYPDNYGRVLTQWGNDTSFEAWVLARDFVNWQRVWEFSVNPTNATTGEINGNPTADDVVLIWAPSGNTQVRYQTGSGTANTQHVTPSGSNRVGDWVHIACVSETINFVNPYAGNAARNYVYFNGVLMVNQTGYLPRNVPRNLAWLGRSAFVSNGDPSFHGFIDSFSMYSYPLSAEAIFAHMKTERPPFFELIFSKSPSTLTGAASPTFGWMATDGPSNGVLTVSGTSQGVDLLTSTGASSVGTSMTATQGGASSGSPAVPGWSYSTIVKFTALAANAPIFDFKDASTNRVRMYINANSNVVFSWNAATTTSSSAVVTGRYYHLAVTVALTGVITLYIDNSTVATATLSSVSAITFTNAYLGQSTDAIPNYLNGLIDAFRVYDTVLSADEVQGLTSTINNVPNGLGSTALRPMSTVPQSGPIMSYTFDNPPGPLGTEGFSNWTWVPSQHNTVDHSGMAYLDGTGLVSLVDTRDDYGNLYPTLYGGEMTIETRFQFLASANQAMVFSMFGPLSSANHNIHLFNTWWQANSGGNQVNSYKFEVYQGGSSSAGFCYGCTNGSWAHAIVSIRQPNASDITSAQSAEFNIFINGMLVWQGPGYLPVLTQRPSAYLGLSGWTGDERFYGFVDSFFMYNQALSAEAAPIHAALPIPPSFEATFTRSPVVAGSAFGWAANFTNNIDPVDPAHVGLITLNGASTQYVNLSATSGANFIGFTVPSFVGTGRNTPGVPQSQRQGWSFHIVFRATSVGAGITIGEFADPAGANALNLAFTASALVFTHGTASINCGSIGANAWKDILITIVQDRNLFEGQCYVDGARVQSVPSFPAVPYVVRNSVLLGRSNTGTNSNFAGHIDSFRIMNYALTSEDAYQLFLATSKPDRYFVPAAYTSGPILSYTFDDPPLPSTDPTGSATFNSFNWDRTGPSYAVHVNHTGVVVFNATGNSNALRQYVDTNWDTDAFGNTLPQIIGGSMSFETWICMGSPTRPGQAIFDFGDNPSNAWNGAQAAGQYNILLASALAGSANLLNFESFDVPQQSQAVTADVLTPGTWQHLSVVVNAAANNQSAVTIYVNGVQCATGTISTPPARFRRSAFIGRSNWDRPALFATMDSFYVYNYPLDVSQIQLHMAIPYPPAFDASFERNPLFNTQGSNYGWLAVDPSAPSHRGVLTFNGNAQFVDLNQGDGGLSIGQYFPILNGPSVGSPDQAGFTFEISLKWNELNNIRPVIELGNSNAVDAFRFGTDGTAAKLYTQNGLTDERIEIPLFNATVGIWYHVVITAAPVTGSNGTMTYTCYVNGARNSSAVGYAPISMIRRTSFIGRSAEIPTGPPFWFSGSLDLLRYYAYVTSPATIRTLYDLTQVVVIPPASSSSTGVAGSSSAPSSSSSFAPSSSSSAAPVVCRGAGYSLDSLVGQVITLDTITSSTQYRYAISPCSTINQPGLCRGMICQNNTALARWDPDRQVTSWWAVDNGFQIEVENGDMCGSTPRRVDILWQCNAQAVIPALRSVTEGPQCRYTVVVDSSLACTPVSATGGQQVGDDWYDSRCGGGAYDLSGLATMDIERKNDSGFNFSIALCSAVRNPLCANLQPVSICQQQGTSAYKLADYITTSPLWSLNADGMNVTSFSGADCGTYHNRTTTVKLVCTPSASTPVVVYYREVSTCSYLFIVNTNAVCGTPFRIPSSSSTAAVVPTSSLRPSSSSSSTVVARSSSSSSATVSSSSSSVAVARSSSSSSAGASSSSIASATSSSSTTPQQQASSSSTIPQQPDSSSSGTSTPSSDSGVGSTSEPPIENPDGGNLNSGAATSMNVVVLMVAALVAVIVA